MSGYMSQRAELRDETAKLAALERDRADLRARIADLRRPEVLEARARANNMIKPGERAFIVRGDLEPAPESAGPDADDGGPLGWITGIF